MNLKNMPIAIILIIILDFIHGSQKQVLLKMKKKVRPAQKGIKPILINCNVVFVYRLYRSILLPCEICDAF